MIEKKQTKPIKYATIVLDTSTEVETILRQYSFEELAAVKENKKKLAPNEYVMRNMLMTALFDSTLKAGINLVTIQYMKEKWNKGKDGNFYNTGEMIIDGWQRTETQADINLESSGKDIVIVSNRFQKPEEFGHSFEKLVDYDDVTNYLLGDIYEDDEEYPNLAVSITGRAKTGKTHFAFTFPQPIKVYCFNRGADFIKAKRFPKAHIDIVNFDVPTIDELEPKAWAEPVWKGFYSDFKKTVETSQS